MNDRRERVEGERKGRREKREWVEKEELMAMG